jgi:hypothetical protein
MSQILGEMNYQKYKKLPIEDMELESNLGQETGDDEEQPRNLAPHAADQNYSSPKKSQRISYIMSPCNDRVDVLYKKEVIKEMKLNDKKERIRQETMKECTFQPNCIKGTHDQSQMSLMNKSQVSEGDLIERLYNDQRDKYEILKEIRQAEFDKKADQDLSQCTFHPRINNYRTTTMRYPLTKNNAPKDFYKAVGRMRFATEERERSKVALNHIPVGENYEARMKEPFNPPRCAVADPKNKKAEKPFMYLDVNISAGKTGRIALHKHDDPVDKGRSFAQTFQ